MRFLLAGVLLMVGCLLMALTTFEADTGKAVFTLRSRSEKAAGCLMAIAALVIAARRTPEERAATAFAYYRRHSGELPSEGLRVVRADDEVPF